MGSADLHVHSQYSDGSMTPVQIADRALERGVSLLAIADHDRVEGSIELEPLCAARGIRYVPAVEHTAIHDGRCVHILGYFGHFGHPEYRALIHRARKALDDMSLLLIERMQVDEPRVCVEDFLSFRRDPSLGGWAGIEYLMRRGVTESMMAGTRYYPRYNVFYHDAAFPSLAETLAAIHDAGGVAIVAHPGETLKDALMAEPDEMARAGFLCALNELIDQGCDGVECYYPSHSDWVTWACVDLCKQGTLMVTVGSDCHGIFAYGTDVGEMSAPESLVYLHVEQKLTNEM